MSILEVKNLSHGFGDRAIFEDVSFRLLKGEHIGLVGANGEGKSTFMSIVTGKMQPDEGKVEWSKYVTAGYLDQHSVLEEGQTVRDVLRTAFDELFTAEARINDLYMAMAEEGADVDALMEEVGELQERLESRACSWGHGLWDGHGCDLLVRWPTDQGPLGQTLARKTRYPSLGRANQLLGCRAHRLAQALLAEL